MRERGFRAALLPVAAGLLACSTWAQSERPRSPRELGTVRWLRDEAAAQAAARASQRPLLVLFQEVPG